jgi:hypothetical protein
MLPPRQPRAKTRLGNLETNCAQSTDDGRRQMFQKRWRKNDEKKAAHADCLVIRNRKRKQLVFRFDSPAVRNFALVHPQAETAIRIRANPGLEQHRSAFLSIIGQGNQRARVTLLALRPLHHPRLLSADPNRIARA